jgi:hypothetical protein
LDAAQLKDGMQLGTIRALLGVMYYVKLLASFGFTAPPLDSARHINMCIGVGYLVGLHSRSVI